VSGTLPAVSGTLPAVSDTLPAVSGTLPAAPGTLPAVPGTLPAVPGTPRTAIRDCTTHRTHFAGSRRHRCAIGICRPLPKALVDTRMVGAAWRRLNSFVSTMRRMRATSSRS